MYGSRGEVCTLSTPSSACVRCGAVPGWLRELGLGVQEALRKQQAKAAAAAEARAARKSALKERVQQAREWDAEEVRMLDKALQKFPVGVPRRWEQVAAYVRTRTQDEILFMVKVRLGCRC